MKRTFNSYFVPHVKGRTYLIFNKGNNNQIIFRDSQDIKRFVKKFKFYFAPFVDILSYSFLPTHFHLEFRVKSKFKKFENRYVNIDKVIERYRVFSKRTVESIIIGELMRRFFMSYAKYYNRKYQQEGSLFTKNYRRILLETTDEIRNAIIFVHKNPQKHNLVRDFRNYIWSSYQIYKDQAKWRIVSGKMFNKLFDNKANMELAHENCCVEYYDI